MYIKERTDSSLYIDVSKTLSSVNSQFHLKLKELKAENTMFWIGRINEIRAKERNRKRRACFTAK